MSAHTPGPWKYAHCPHERRYEVWPGDGYILASVPTIARREKESEANARLIAAAPEMLEALRYCDSLFSEMDRHALITPAMEELVYGKVSSAIRKATEEEV